MVSKHSYSPKKKVEVDECYPWVAFARPRELAVPKKERNAAAAAYVDEVFGEQLQAMQAQSREKLQKARKIANIF